MSTKRTPRKAKAADSAAEKPPVETPKAPEAVKPEATKATATKKPAKDPLIKTVSEVAELSEEERQAFRCAGGTVTND
jgi:hypothetical protein